MIELSNPTMRANEGYAVSAPPTPRDSFRWTGPALMVLHSTLLIAGRPWLAKLGLGISNSLIAVLVGLSIIAACVDVFAQRQLTADPRQSQFLTALRAVFVATTIWIVADNVLWSMASLVVTHIGLSRTLVHGNPREAAKMSIQLRLAPLLASLSALAGVCIFAAVNGIPLQFSSLVEWSARHPHTSGTIGVAIGFAVAIAALSNLYPSYPWLLSSIEGPTPASAQLHAGVVNAGAILFLKVAPIMLGTPLAVGALILLALATCGFATIKQQYATTVKQRLAISTIAQMAFLTLELSFGAPVAATLHLIGHAAYKANAFLGAGKLDPNPQSRPQTLPLIHVFSGVTCLCGAGVYPAFNLSPIEALLAFAGGFTLSLTLAPTGLRSIATTGFAAFALGMVHDLLSLPWTTVPTVHVPAQLLVVMAITLAFLRIAAHPSTQQILAEKA